MQKSLLDRLPSCSRIVESSRPQSRARARAEARLLSLGVRRGERPGAAVRAKGTESVS